MFDLQPQRSWHLHILQGWDSTTGCSDARCGDASPDFSWGHYREFWKQRPCPNDSIVSNLAARADLRVRPNQGAATNHHGRQKQPPILKHVPIDRGTSRDEAAFPDLKVETIIDCSRVDLRPCSNPATHQPKVGLRKERRSYEAQWCQGHAMQR